MQHFLGGDLIASIADVYVTVIPETSKVAEGIRKAFREVDKDAREAGNRWGREIKQGMGEIRPDVEPETAKAKTELEKFRAEQERKKIRQKIEFDEADFNEKLSIVGKKFDGVGSKFGSGLKVNLGLAGIGLLPAAATAITDVAGSIQQLAGAGLALPGIFSGLASSVGVAVLGMHGMKDALEAVNKAADGTQKSVDAANKALAELAPNQAEAVRTVAGLKGTFTDLRNIAGQNLFAGFSSGLKALISADLPALTKGIDGVSRGLNTNLLQSMKSLGSDSSQGFLSRIFGNTADAQAIASRAIDPLVHAFGTLTAAGSDTLPRLATALGSVADRFNAFITNADNDGRLSKWINDGLTGFTHLGNILLNIGRTFTGLTEASGGGAGLLSMLENLTSKMAVFVNSTAGQQKLRDFFQQGRDLLGQLRDVAVQTGPVLGGIFQAGIGAARVWLPIIERVLSTINSIPGGAAAVVYAFAAWKTIQGPIALANSLTSIAGLLQKTLPAAAATGAASMSTSLAGVASTLAGIATAAAALPATAVGFAAWGNSVLHNAPNSNENARARGAAGLAGANDQARPTDPRDPMSGGGVNMNRPLGVPTLPQGPNVWGLRPPPGSAAAAAAPPPSGLGSYANLAVPYGAAVPDVSSYAPPVVTEAPKGTPNLPYAGTADPYGGMYGGYTSDAALLANVPKGTGQYDNVTKDLSKGLVDCASGVEDLVNIIDGKSTAGGSLWTGNAASVLPGMGFMPGEGGPGDFRVGYNDHHMQATLPGGTNVNFGSTSAIRAGGQDGGAGAFDPSFTQHWYRPTGADPMSTMYGGSPVGGTGLTSSDLSLRNARQRVNDTQHSEEQAQGRLNELRAKGTATDRQMEAAEYALAKAKREHQDAIDGLTVATDKYNKSQAKGQDGNGDMSSLGGDLFGGVLEAIGLDGSLFKNPFQSGMWKGVTGVANFAGALGQAQAGQTGSMIPGGSGGGLGGLLGMASSFMPGISGMPGMPGGNSPNIVDAAQFKPPGVAGPGNAAPAGYQNGGIDLRGASFGDSHGELTNQINAISSSQQRYPALAQNLPK